jgi:hypothetical protein
MKKRGLLMASLLLFVLTDFFVPAASAFARGMPEQDQPQRSIFYALGVICEKDVQNAKESLGAPDGRFAEILPGGQLVMLMKNKLYSFPFGFGEYPAYLASGKVVGKGGPDFSFEGWFARQDMQGRQYYDWISLGILANGFFLPLISSLPPSDIRASTDIIRISNRGAKPLFVDAVIGYGKDVLTNDALLGQSKIIMLLRR